MSFTTTGQNYEITFGDISEFANRIEEWDFGFHFYTSGNKIASTIFIPRHHYREYDGSMPPNVFWAGCDSAIPGKPDGYGKRYLSINRGTTFLNVMSLWYCYNPVRAVHD